MGSWLGGHSLEAGLFDSQFLLKQRQRGGHVGDYLNRMSVYVPAGLKEKE